MNIPWYQVDVQGGTLTACAQRDPRTVVVYQRTEAECWSQVSEEMDPTSIVSWRRRALANPVPAPAALSEALDRYTLAEQREMGWIR